MAALKYKDPGKSDTYTEAVRMIIEDDLQVFFNINKWQEWRETQLWTLEVNDVFEANLDGLKKIFKSYFTTKRSYMDMQDSLNLLNRSSNLIPIEKDVIHCFAMSKMTLPNEIAKRKDYNSLQLVEFIEFLARVSEFRHRVRKSNPKQEDDKTEVNDPNVEFSIDKSLSLPENGMTRNEEEIKNDSSMQRMLSTVHSNHENKTLVQKIEDLLDEVLPNYNLKRKEVKIEIEFETDSESESD